MADFDPADVILEPVPHQSEGFSNAVAVIENQKGKEPNRARVAAGSPSQKPLHIQQGGPRLTPKNSEEYNGRLVLLFSHGAYTSYGVVGGTDPEADLCMQSVQSVSGYHFTFTFDEENMPIVRDLGSVNGTKVTYGGQEGPLETSETWSLVGPSIVNEPPILNIADRIQFKVLLGSHDYKSPTYIEKVKKFRKGTKSPAAMLKAIHLKTRPVTQLNSEQQTPEQRQSNSSSRIKRVYKKKIGDGAFGIVTYMWDFATREEYVIKTPKEMPKGATEYIEDWRSEVKIMKRISHENIVKLRDATFDPHPTLELDYVPGSELGHYPDLTKLHKTQVLLQLSSALKYLHSQEPPIVHRDIKPNNILVQSEDSDGIHVKFSDFGLAKQAEALGSTVGTWQWAAPEIWQKWTAPDRDIKSTYTKAVDIWSLGAVMASLENAMPSFARKMREPNLDWIRHVMGHVEAAVSEQPNELLRFIFERMLVEDPANRATADEVHSKAERLFEIEKGDHFIRVDASSFTRLQDVEQHTSDRTIISATTYGHVEEELEPSDDERVSETFRGDKAEAPKGTSFVSGDGSENTQRSALKVTQPKEDTEKTDHGRQDASLLSSHLPSEGKNEGEEPTETTDGTSSQTKSPATILRNTPENRDGANFFGGDGSQNTQRSALDVTQAEEDTQKTDDRRKDVSLPSGHLTIEGRKDGEGGTDAASSSEKTQRPSEKRKRADDEYSSTQPHPPTSNENQEPRDSKRKRVD